MRGVEIWNQTPEFRPDLGDVTLEMRAGGLKGLSIYVLNGLQDAAITPSSTSIISTLDLDKRTLYHEREHIRQAQQLGAWYIPKYIGLIPYQILGFATFNVAGRHVSFHDAHPMEREAILWDTGIDPWRR